MPLDKLGIFYLAWRNSLAYDHPEKKLDFESFHSCLPRSDRIGSMYSVDRSIFVFFVFRFVIAVQELLVLAF